MNDRWGSVTGERHCPACQTPTNALWCPKDGTATLKRGVPRIDPDELTAGEIVAGRYRLESKLGGGGFGTVFAARHTGTSQPIALKVLKARVDDDESVLARFFHEARITAALKHPNTVRVFDFGQDDSGIVFLAMEHVSGKTIAQELRERWARGVAFTEGEAVWIASEILRSLAEAHGAGLVHRDLKPDNIMIHGLPGEDSAAVKVLDFGIAKIRDAELTLGGVAPCTPAFASPEQVTGAPLDGRSDLYTVGIILFLLVTGELPFKSKKPMELMYMQAKRPAPSLKGRPDAQVSDVFAELVERALSKDPARRFQDANEMREALAACAGSGVELRAPPAPTLAQLPAPYPADPVATVPETPPKRATSDVTPDGSNDEARTALDIVFEPPPLQTRVDRPPSATARLDAQASDRDVTPLESPAQAPASQRPPIRGAPAIVGFPTTVPMLTPTPAKLVSGLAAEPPRGGRGQLLVVALLTVSALGLAAIVALRTREAPPERLELQAPSASASPSEAPIAPSVVASDPTPSIAPLVSPPPSPAASAPPLAPVVGKKRKLSASPAPTASPAASAAPSPAPPIPTPSPSKPSLLDKPL